MTDLAHQLIWFIASAIVITTVLTVGTLAAAGILPRRDPDRTPPTGPERPVPHDRS